MVSLFFPFPLVVFTGCKPVLFSLLVEASLLSCCKNGIFLCTGTGHGVGAALNVHEGPQSISFRFGNLTPLQKGMIVSNEPGYYEDHAFGIRIEVLFYLSYSFCVIGLLYLISLVLTLGFLFVIYVPN